MKVIKTQMELVTTIQRLLFREGFNGLTIYDVGVLLFLADKVNHTHKTEMRWRCYYSQEQIANAVCFSKRRVAESISNLQKKGWLEYKRGICGFYNNYKVDISTIGRDYGLVLSFADKSITPVQEDDDEYDDYPL